MIRRVGNVVCLLCLLLAPLAGFEWLRIGGHDRHHAFALDGQLVFISISRDWGISIDWLSGYSPAELDTAFASKNRPILIPRGGRDKDLGIVIVCRATGRFMQNASAARLVPLRGLRAHWHSLLICLSLAPIFWLYRLTKARLLASRRQKRGLCLRCGYDLRASAGRCPECGAAIDPGTCHDLL